MTDLNPQDAAYVGTWLINVTALKPLPVEGRGRPVVDEDKEELMKLYHYGGKHN